MRWSILLLVALVAIGIAATVDALRGSETVRMEPGAEETSAEPATTARTPSPAEVLSEAEVTGTLYFTLPAEEGCVLHTLALPGLEGANAFPLDHCEFDVSPRGDVVSGGPCPGTDIELRPLGGPPRHLRGCAPAWTPDGELTYVRDGDVLTLGGGAFVHDVARFARNALGSDNLAVQQVAWLTETRLAARVTARGVQPSAVVVIEEGKAVSEPLFADRDAQIEISHATEEILVTFSGGGVEVFGPSGEFVSANRFPFGGISAVSYSPSGRFVTLGRQGNLCIYEETDPPPRERFPLACLPFDVVDLAWG